MLGLRSWIRMSARSARLRMRRQGRCRSVGDIVGSVMAAHPWRRSRSRRYRQAIYRRSTEAGDRRDRSSWGGSGRKEYGEPNRARHGTCRARWPRPIAARPPLCGASSVWLSLSLRRLSRMARPRSRGVRICMMVRCRWTATISHIVERRQAENVRDRRHIDGGMLFGVEPPHGCHAWHHDALTSAVLVCRRAVTNNPVGSQMASHRAVLCDRRPSEAD